MKKQIISIVILIAFSLALTACDSENVKSAKTAYEAENYSEVITALESEQELDEDVAEMLSISKAHVAYDEGKYLDAITELAAVENGKDMDLYSDAVKGLIDKAIEKSSAKNLLKAIELDPAIGNTAVKDIKEQCDALNYGAFKLMDKLLKKMPESEAKTSLQKYHDENEFNKPKAFLLGKWEWQSSGDTKTSVSCIQHKDNLIATVDVVGDNEKDYKILKDDVYWKDFDFLEKDRFTCICLCKTGEGTGVECTTVGTINYKKDTLHLHLTAPDPYWMDAESSDRDWKRISQ